MRFEKGGKSLVVVPKSLRNEVLKLLHCQFAVDHFTVNEIIVFVGDKVFKKMWKT